MKRILVLSSLLLLSISFCKSMKELPKSSEEAVDQTQIKLINQNIDDLLQRFQNNLCDNNICDNNITILQVIVPQNFEIMDNLLELIMIMFPKIEHLMFVANASSLSLKINSKLDCLLYKHNCGFFIDGIEIIDNIETDHPVNNWFFMRITSVCFNKIKQFLEDNLISREKKMYE